MKIVSSSIGKRRQKWRISAIKSYVICRKFWVSFQKKRKETFFKSS